MTDKSEQTAAEKRKFTTWKMDILDGIMSDIRLKEGVKIFAFHVMQHVSSTSKKGWPGLDRLCGIMDCSLRTVKRHSKELEESGWIKRSRKDRNSTYNYEFTDTYIEAVKEATEHRITDAMIKAEDRRLKQSEVTPTAPRKPIRGDNQGNSEVTNGVISEVTAVSPKHLLTELPYGTPELEGSGIETSVVGVCSTNQPYRDVENYINKRMIEAGASPEEIRAMLSKAGLEKWGTVDAFSHLQTFKEGMIHEAATA